MSQWIPISVLITSSISWGLTWIPLKYFHTQGVNGVVTVFLVYGVATLVLMPWFIKQKPLWSAHVRVIALIAVLGGYANLAFSYSMVYGEVVRAMVLFYLSPVWAVLGGYFFLRENVDLLRWLGVGLAIVGAFLIVGGFDFSLNTYTLVDLIAVTAGITFAMTNITFRANASMPIMSNVAAIFLGCSVMSGLLIFFGTEAWPAISTSTLSSIIVYGIAWILVASIASQWAVTKLEASRTAVIIVMELVAATLSATLLGEEILTVTETIGIFLVVSATILETMRSTPTAKELQPLN